MKTILFQSLIVIAICVIIMIAVSIVDIFPWWIFLLPVLLFGNALSNLKLKLNFFLLGFISGFLLWFVGNLLFDFKYSGFTLTKCANLLSIPKLLLIFLSGIIGGLLAGTAMYVGTNIFKKESPSGLDN